ncbi:MAG: sulfur carrier protein ThiS [Ruminococcus sp.]|nr:sulfur carrier protein ThiS [Ruminococcus sp.]
MIKINGIEKDSAGKSVAEFLAENGYDIKRVAVEMNEDILPKSQYESTFLKDGDVIEVVSFVGGG